jgi:predicted 3-demethylubiquinone-9 3-methyltransferase (glyoxalase superfamily)
MEDTMPIAKSKLTPCLWFDHEAEAAAKFYVSVFASGRIGRVARYGKAGQEVHGRPAGSVMTVEFELDGQDFVALNGGPVFKFTEAVSFQVHCDNQDEIDHYWNRLGEGGEEGPCGWLKDKYGLSWQIVPAVLPKLMTDADGSKSERVMNAFLKMKKFDVATLQRAYEGRPA